MPSTGGEVPAIFMADDDPQDGPEQEVQHCAELAQDGQEDELVVLDP